jgi:hypothetical protein
MGYHPECCVVAVMITPDLFATIRLAAMRAIRKYDVA